MRKKILYSICGEGMGHAVRSSVIIQHLIKNNDVVVLSSGRAYGYLSKKFDRVYKIAGFNMIYENNAINNLKTFLMGVKRFPKMLRSDFIILLRLIRKFKPDLIISDFEFFSNLVGKIKNIPVITINNISIITETKIRVKADFVLNKLRAGVIAKLFTIFSRKYLITTYFYPEIRNKRKTKLFPPTLRTDILKLKSVKGNHILIYQTSDTYKKLIPILKQLNQKFIVYGFNEEKKEENIQFRKFNETNFYKELASCKAIITNAGFTLIGEAIHLGKPILSIPVKKHFEQFVNAYYLDKLGYGKFYQDIDKEKLGRFISNLDKHRKALKSYKRENNNKILAEVDRLLEFYLKQQKL